MLLAKIVLIVAIVIAIVLGLVFRFRDRWRALKAKRAESQRQRAQWHSELERDLNPDLE